MQMYLSIIAQLSVSSVANFHLIVFAIFIDVSFGLHRTSSTFLRSLMATFSLSVALFAWHHIILYLLSYIDSKICYIGLKTLPLEGV